MDDRAAERPTLGRTLRGLFDYGHLLRNLVVKDLKLRYRGSVLGFVWSLANPVLMIAVYTVAFTYILRLRTPGFVFYLMLGVLAWTFFANAVAMSAGAVVDNGGLVRSVWFPRAILPIATRALQLRAVPADAGRVPADFDALVPRAAGNADAGVPGFCFCS